MSNVIRNVGIAVAVTGTTVAVLVAIGAYKFKKALKVALEDPDFDAKVAKAAHDIEVAMEAANNVVDINSRTAE